VNDILRNIWSGLTSAPALDQANLVLGVVGVALMIRRSLWAFPIGLAAVTVQGVLFFRTRIYADALLQVFFFVTLAWGWRHWLKGRVAATELPVTQLGWRGSAVVVVLAAVATVILARRVRGGVQRGGPGSPGAQADRDMAAVDRGQPGRDPGLLERVAGVFGFLVPNLPRACRRGLGGVGTGHERRRPCVT
jgi:hypothetical protein